MKNVEVITQRINEWEKMSVRGIGGREREKYSNNLTAAPTTVSAHFIPMQQEIYNLREALAAAAVLCKKILKDEDTVNAIDKIRNFQ